LSRWPARDADLYDHYSADGKPILNLPKRTVEVISCFFDPAEREFYDAFEKKQELSFNKVCSILPRSEKGWLIDRCAVPESGYRAF
jgi:hypothetical protein